MHRFLSTPLAIAALTAIALVAGDQATADELFRGQVIATSGNELAVSVSGDVMRFKVSPEAVITVDGQPAELGQLLPDHIVEVTAKRKGEGWTAVWIEATSQILLVKSGPQAR